MQRQAPLQQLAAKCEAEPQGAQGWRALEEAVRVGGGTHRAGTGTLAAGAFPITSPLPFGCSLLSNLLPEVLLSPALWPSWLHVKAAPLANPLHLQAGQERGQALQPGKRGFSKSHRRLFGGTGNQPYSPGGSLGAEGCPPGVAKPLEMARTSSWAAAVSLGSTCVCRS